MKNYYSTVDHIVLTFSDIKKRMDLMKLLYILRGQIILDLILRKESFLIICFISVSGFQRMNYYSLNNI